MGDIKAYVLQKKDGKVLAVETNLKKLVSLHGEKYNLYSYQHLQRLVKKAKDKGSGLIAFTGKQGNNFILSWWNL